MPGDLSDAVILCSGFIRGPGDNPKPLSFSFHNKFKQGPLLSVVSHLISHHFFAVCLVFIFACPAHLFEIEFDRTFKLAIDLEDYKDTFK